MIFFVFGKSYSTARWKPNLYKYWRKNAQLWKIDDCRYDSIFVFHNCWTLVSVLYRQRIIMLSLFLYFKKYIVRFIVITISIILLSQLFYSAILSALIYKYNFIYLMSTSQITGKLSVWGFCFFIFMVLSGIFLQLKNIFK